MRMSMLKNRRVVFLCLGFAVLFAVMMTDTADTSTRLLVRNYQRLSLHIASETFSQRNQQVISDTTTRPPAVKATVKVKVKNELPVINNFRFSYPINVRQACVNRTIDIVMPVHSAVTNFDRRSQARKGQQHKFAKRLDNNVLMLFFVGLPSKKLKNAVKQQALLEKEAAKFGDIVQMNITDTYRNLVSKAMGTLNWILTLCHKAEVILKTDDDVRIYPSVLILAIYKKLNKYPDFVIGELRVDRGPTRNTSKRYVLTVNEYPDDKYPPFVPGPAIGYPISTARLLYQRALRTKIVWLDDLFLTGICRHALGIPVFNDDNFKVNTVHRKMKTRNFVYGEIELEHKYPVRHDN